MFDSGTGFLMLHALSPKTFLKNFQVSAKNQRMKPDNKIETERFMERYENTNSLNIRFYKENEDHYDI